MAETTVWQNGVCRQVRRHSQSDRKDGDALPRSHIIVRALLASLRYPAMLKNGPTSVYGRAHASYRPETLSDCESSSTTLNSIQYWSRILRVCVSVIDYSKALARPRGAEGEGLRARWLSRIYPRRASSRRGRGNVATPAGIPHSTRPWCKPRSGHETILNLSAIASVSSL